MASQRMIKNVKTGRWEKPGPDTLLPTSQPTSSAEGGPSTKQIRVDNNHDAVLGIKLVSSKDNGKGVVVKWIDAHSTV